MEKQRWFAPAVLAFGSLALGMFIVMVTFTVSLFYPNSMLPMKIAAVVMCICILIAGGGMVWQHIEWKRDIYR